jgi:aryl-alcohol dehydrogenase-like predicted oxidoreductase
MAERYKKSVGQLAINWVLNNDVVTSAIVGARTTQQVEQNAGATEWRINDADMQHIASFLDADPEG